MPIPQHYTSTIRVLKPNIGTDTQYWITHSLNSREAWLFGFFSNLLLISFTSCLRPPFGTLEHLAERWSNWTSLPNLFQPPLQKEAETREVIFHLTSFLMRLCYFWFHPSSRVKKFFPLSRHVCSPHVGSAQVIRGWIQSRSSQQAPHLSGINNITDLQEQRLKRKNPPTTVLKDASFRPIVLVTAQPTAAHHPLGLLVSNRTKVVETTSATATKRRTESDKSHFHEFRIKRSGRNRNFFCCCCYVFFSTGVRKWELRKGDVQ